MKNHDCPKCAGRGVMKRSIHERFEPCDCTKVQENFKAGEKVTFTLIGREGGGFQFSSREGTVVEDKGDSLVTVAVRGRFYYPGRKEVRRKGEKTALTEAFERLANDLEREPKDGPCQL